MRLRVLLASGTVLAVLGGPMAVPSASATSSAAESISRANLISQDSLISKDKAKRLAKAALLKKTDLPGYRYEKSTTDPSDAQYDTALYACVGVAKPTYLAENPGNAFTKGPLEVDSESSVVDTGKHAKADYKALNTAKGATCYQQVIRTVFEEQGMTVDSVAVKLIKAPVEGTSKSFGFSYDVKGVVNGVPIRLQGFDVNVLVGQTEFSLSSYRFDGKRPKLTQLQTLAAPIVQRIRAV